MTTVLADGVGNSTSINEALIPYPNGLFDRRNVYQVWAILRYLYFFPFNFRAMNVNNCTQSKFYSILLIGFNYCFSMLFRNKYVVVLLKEHVQRQIVHEIVNINAG